MPRPCAFSAKSRYAGPLTARLWSPPPEAWVTDEARQAFDRALTEQPGQPQARYYLALATEQDGKKADAIRDYQALLADSAPDAPWRNMVNAHLAALKGKPAPAMEAAAIPEAQRPMIEGMVSKLATRLASNGGGVDEWSRLIRAYTVLHEADKAKGHDADIRLRRRYCRFARLHARLDIHVVFPISGAGIRERGKAEHRRQHGNDERVESTAGSHLGFPLCLESNIR